MDESGFAHDMPRTQGYATVGKRCYGHHAWRAKGPTHVIAALVGQTLTAVTLFACHIDANVIDSQGLKQAGLTRKVTYFVKT